MRGTRYVRKKMFSVFMLALLFFLPSSLQKYSPTVIAEEGSFEKKVSDEKISDDTKEKTSPTDGTPVKDVEGKGAPKIYIPETLFDFGTVPQRSSYSHKFTVRNIGDSPLKLIRAKGS